MNAERRERQIRIAKTRNDRAALAILEADRRFLPDPETPMLSLHVWAGVRWSERKAA